MDVSLLISLKPKNLNYQAKRTRRAVQRRSRCQEEYNICKCMRIYSADGSALYGAAKTSWETPKALNAADNTSATCGCQTYQYTRTQTAHLNNIVQSSSSTPKMELECFCLYMSDSSQWALTWCMSHVGGKQLALYDLTLSWAEFSLSMWSKS